MNDTRKIQRINRDYYEKLYADEWENLEEMDIFVDTNDLPTLNQEDIKKKA
jgi:hypothetical protein